MRLKHFLFLLAAFNISLLVSSPVMAGDDEHHHNSDNDNRNNKDDNDHNKKKDKDESFFSWFFPKDDPSPRAPIDGGIGILLVAGVGYGIKRVADKKKKLAEK